MEINRCVNCMCGISEGEEICPRCGYDFSKGEQVRNALRKNSMLKRRYLVGNILGQGGFGITYIGYDLELDIRVAIKEYYPAGMVMRDCTRSNELYWNNSAAELRNQKSGIERFVQEARKMAKLDEIPAIVRVRDSFQENRTAYIVMDFVEGITLKEYLLKYGVMDYASCTALLKPVMESLSHIHKAGLIHRDISPDNIMIQSDGTVRLLDMGAAVDMKAEHGGASMTVAKTGFSAPEQYMENGELGSWTDVYAMCATIYYCLSGKLPPEAMKRMMKPELAAVSFAMGGDVPENAAACLQKGMNLKVENRIQAIDELYHGLTEPEPKPEPEPEPIPEPKPIRLKKIILAAVTAVVVISVAARFLSTDGDSGTTWADNVLMADYMEKDEDYDYDGSVLGSDISRDEILTVTFLDSLADMPETAWDVSEDGSGRVMAWTEQGDGGYDLYIGGNGGVAANENTSNLFRSYDKVRQIHMNGSFHTKNAVDMGCMFYDCKNLSSVDVSGFDTANVTDMRWMFGGCANLSSVDVSSFDTENVVVMGGMFCDCVNLSSVDVSGFDTGNVTNMNSMFGHCANLSSVDVSGFDTGNVTDMGCMFSDCRNLSSVDVSGFDTGNVTNMNGMFCACANLSSVDVSSFDTGNVTDMSLMFSVCANLSSVDVSGFDTGNVTNMNSMFGDCENLSSVDVSGFDTGNVTSMNSMFCACANLSSVDVSGLDTANVEDTRGMFSGCGKLRGLDVSNFKPELIADMELTSENTAAP